MGIDVKRAVSGDLDAVADLFDLYRQFYKQSSDLPGAKAFLAERMERDQSVIFLAEYAGAALGFTQVYPSFTSAGMAPIFILNDLFVVPEARGSGVGRALLCHTAEFARGEGATRLVLSTATDNLTAQAVYERAGWERDDGFLTYRLTL
ncbi:MAG: GNAT family N-acetyltransferase [Candidatus Andeanibacterium colombiense]|uniref:GNAT family N-acetyltransferase n=1 Tax=Candidatus Andeanibacterium colombiense TaxID=3121345 RepID=A0AAJ5X504_9SPHN|nr:MAG: GNAT family N-acetyltransferase [Sphingomonadaceae bacterium]